MHTHNGMQRKVAMWRNPHNPVRGKEHCLDSSLLFQNRHEFFVQEQHPPSQSTEKADGVMSQTPGIRSIMSVRSR